MLAQSRPVFVSLSLILLLAAACRPAAAPADLLLFNGRVFTGDRSRPWAESIAVRGDRIVAVGSNADVQSQAHATKRIDLHGRLLIPGINDAHDHPGMAPYGVEAHTRVAPMDDPTLDDVAAAIREAAQQAPPGAWIHLMTGFTAMTDPKATRAAVAKAAGDHPVLIKPWWGHGVILNDLALARLGITEASTDPPGGRYQRDATGRLTGKLEEYAGWHALMRLVSTAGLEKTVPAFRTYATRRLAEGVTSVQAMSGYLEPKLFVDTLAAAASPLRVRLIRFAFSTAGDPTGMNAWSGLPAHPAARVRVSGIKWILDGTPIPVDQNAWMTRPYPGRPQWYGHMNFDAAFVERELRTALNGRDQLLMHTVGDATWQFVLQTMRRLAPAETWKPLRVRLEHAPLTGEDLRLAVAMGVVVGQPRFDTAPLRTMLDGGLVVAYGSDEGSFPPFVAFQLMIGRARKREALTREAAMAVLTSAGAWAEFAEKDKGRLMPGMLADFAVLSQDVFQVPEEQIPATRSLLTVVGGKIAYHEDGW
jgi:predicted amidohydrolase YtcJ